MNQQVILVNHHDEQIGVANKLEAHQQCLLHRAFSIFIINDNNEMLIHKRAAQKYHSGGLWSNACCSHPQPNETLEAATKRRLLEELGISTPLHFAFNFVYQTPLDNKLFEYEFDHVFVGRYNDILQPNFEEVESCEYVELDSISKDIISNPNKYTIWFKIAYPKVCEWIQSNPF